MKIQILIDNQNSWMNEYSSDLLQSISELNNQVCLIQNHKQIEKGDILLLLSCEKKLEYLNLNKHNLVIHASNLPKGKGWSPLSWQVLEGKKLIPVTIFEADNKIDNGLIYEKIFIELTGTELLDELRLKLYDSIKKLIINFILKYPNNKGEIQTGESSYYKKRVKKDSKLDLNLSLKDQFNLLRVVDNDRYPAFFYYESEKYYLKIYKEKNENRK